MFMPPASGEVKEKPWRDTKPLPVGRRPIETYALFAGTQGDSAPSNGSVTMGFPVSLGLASWLERCKSCDEQRAASSAPSRMFCCT
jgi:hypothetical protein